MLKKAKAQARREAEAGKHASDDHGAGTGDRQGKDIADTVLESSRQIWLAGLGAFARARGEGVKVFETLVQQGQALETRTRAAAADTAAAARDAAQAKARSMQAKAGGTWDKLEQVFEERVARALARLGVHTHSDVERLAERVDALSEAVHELVRSRGGASGSGSAGGAPGARNAGTSTAEREADASARRGPAAGSRTRRTGTTGQGAATRRDLRKAADAAGRDARAGAAKGTRGIASKAAAAPRGKTAPATRRGAAKSAAGAGTATAKSARRGARRGRGAAADASGKD